MLCAFLLVGACPGMGSVFELINKNKLLSGLRGFPQD